MSYDICSPICVAVGVPLALRVSLNLPLLYVLRTYNPPDGRGRKNPASKEKAMAELIDAVSLSFTCFFCAFLYQGGSYDVEIIPM